MKRTRLNRRSRTNSRNVEDLDLQSQYRIDNPECELSDILPWGKDHDDDQGWWTILYNHQIDPRRRFARLAANEVHHICHVGNRPDHVCNLISLSKPAHAWVHRYGMVGKLVCWYAKWRKGEFDRHEINEFYRKDPIGVIEYLDVHEWPWLEGMQRVMLEAH